MFALVTFIIYKVMSCRHTYELDMLKSWTHDHFKPILYEKSDVFNVYYKSIVNNSSLTHDVR